MTAISKYFSEAEDLLRRLVKITSYSGEESEASLFLFSFLSEKRCGLCKGKE